MRVLAEREFAEFATAVPPLADARMLLDLGGSHGGYSAALCRRWPRLRARIIDLPDAVRHAAPLLAREGIGDRVSHVAADVRRYDLGRDRPDVVLISQLCHHFDDAENRQLLGRVADALEPGGLVIVQDHIAPDDPGAADLVAGLLDFSFGVSSGSALWSAARIREWQRSAGLSPPRADRFAKQPRNHARHGT
ncbi:methyltransferase [Streptomyces sp. S186]|uniref:methyltransferase n=1 Tax=Streptomyces sp. S186 TaxID=3434395 RepID=UPI003F6792AB